MKNILVSNVNGAVAMALPYLLEEGIEETSRTGAVLVAPGPVMTTYNNPLERVLFSPTRDANPFFHLMESLWMLSGRNDLAWPQKFNARFGEYSDDGKTVWGAYGWRWKEFFGYDQLDVIITELKKNPDSRRCVLSMWTADNQPAWNQGSDLQVAVNGGKDVPCNTHAYFDCRNGALNMTVCCRSNDAIWGAYGANVVHFSFLLEYMAAKIGMPVGVYRQFSNNFHAYTDIYDKVKLLAIAKESAYSNMYPLDPYMRIIPLIENPVDFDSMLEDFMVCEGVGDCGPGFLTTVAGPMCRAWEIHKQGESLAARHIIDTMPPCDWRLACHRWLNRRIAKKVNYAA